MHTHAHTHTYIQGVSKVASHGKFVIALFLFQGVILRPSTKLSLEIKITIIFVKSHPGEETQKKKK